MEEVLIGLDNLRLQTTRVSHGGDLNRLYDRYGGQLSYLFNIICYFGQLVFEKNVINAICVSYSVNTRLFVSFHAYLSPR